MTAALRVPAVVLAAEQRCALSVVTRWSCRGEQNTGQLHTLKRRSIHPHGLLQTCDRRRVEQNY